MKINMVDLKKQYASIKDEIDAAIKDVVESTQFIMGRKVSDFESGCADYLGVKHAIACASGTDALQIAMMALDIKPGDEIITTPFTFVATAETIALLGAVPVYVDILNDAYTIDPAKIEAAITAKTKAIIPVHLYGQAADMDPILEIAKKHKLYVIEDAAQAFGTEYKGKKVGTLGTIGATSFFPSKNLGAYGDAGMVFTQDDQLAEKIRMIAAHGSKERYVHEMLGLNSRMDALQAAILGVKLKYIDKWNKARANNAHIYRENLKDANVITPFNAEYSTHIYHQFSIRVKDRKGLQEFLSAKGIPTAVHYPIPLHQQPAFVDEARSFNLPVAETVAKEIISLPMYPELTAEEIEYIASAITEFVGKK
ncbi:MAG: DegT/DnrJ/EryC1/StrS family aminotransferase [Ignavibacteria bacterium]|nr:DegT/DnrJ/EryC1/StrS family aminotransferase [Ignavibacteria bacterium]MCU7503118.1 DegT/DnrJ/EryC1/StrS family aminotransferase [Ignavibacteria bacterium]MCU7518426.1 DegT/DnrJ/EryC1/StrS family aminotransferase [Ignavibacteria bacterium]